MGESGREAGHEYMDDSRQSPPYTIGRGSLLRGGPNGCLLTALKLDGKEA